MIFTVSIMTIAVMFVLGQVAPALAQTIPASNMLVKRDYSYLDDQHLTARFGNTKVCGDHLCAPGEWSKLQESLNQAQISHPVNSTKTVPMPTKTNTTSTTPINSTSTMSPIVPPIPTPIPTPPPTPYSVCTAVKVALGNSTVSSDTITKIMTDLGCNK